MENNSAENGRNMFWIVLRCSSHMRRNAFGMLVRLRILWGGICQRVWPCSSNMFAKVAMGHRSGANLAQEGENKGVNWESGRLRWGECEKMFCKFTLSNDVWRHRSYLPCSWSLQSPRIGFDVLCFCLSCNFLHVSSLCFCDCWHVSMLLFHKHVVILIVAAKCFCCCYCSSLVACLVECCQSHASMSRTSALTAVSLRHEAWKCSIQASPKNFRWLDMIRMISYDLIWILIIGAASTLLLRKTIL